MAITSHWFKKASSLILTLVLGALTLSFLSYWVMGYQSIGEDTVAPSFPSGNEGSVDSIGGRSMDMEEPVKDKLLIKTGSIEITVNDLDESTQKVRDYAKEVGGSVENMFDLGRLQDRRVVVRLRVPSATFESTLGKLKDISVDVITSSEDSSDISEIYLDMEARLKNQKALEAQLVEILQRAVSVEDILAVQTELSRVRGEIESLEASIKYYDSQVSMSTITLTMSRSTENLSVLGDPWRPTGVLREAAAALIFVLKGIGSLAIWIVVFSPLLFITLWVLNRVTKQKK